MTKYYRALAVAPLVVVASYANAQVSNAPTSTPQAAPAPTDEQAASSAASPLMSLDELDEMRGGEQVAVTLQEFNSANTGNSIAGDFTAGDVNLADNSLSSFNGLGNIVINTGAQSALQAGLAVTINITD